MNTGQNKKIIILARVSIIFFLFSIVLGTVFFLGKGKETENKIVINKNSIATTTPTPAVRVESFSYVIDPINITVEYPQIVHMASSSLESAINANLKSEAKEIYEENLKYLKESSSDFVGRTEIVSITPIVSSTTTDDVVDNATTTDIATSTIKTKVVYDRTVIFERKVAKDKTYINNEDKLISFAYEQYIDSGGAHGSFSFASKAIDIESGKDISLDDILKGDYKKVVIKDIEDQIRNKADTCVRCESLLSMSDELEVFVSESFVLSDKGIAFLYSAYDLGAYALTSGGQEITVSKERLSDNISRKW